MSSPSSISSSRKSAGSSSVYSSDHTSDHALEHTSHVRSIANRQTSYTPSYMSNIARRPLPSGVMKVTPIDIPMTSSRPVPQPSEAPGVLLVVSNGTLHPSTLSHIEILLTKQHFSSAFIAVGKEQEAILKQLRMDMYALIGRFSREMSVFSTTKEAFRQSDIEAVVQEATKNGNEIQGVLCCPNFGQGDEDVLGMEEEEFEMCWRESVGFLRSVVKGTRDRLLSRCQPPSKRTNGSLSSVSQSPFFLVQGSTSSQFTKSACEGLIRQLENITTRAKFTVGHAEVILMPYTDEVYDHAFEATSGPFLQPEIYNDYQDASTFPAGESPTKLWNMWALQEEVGILRKGKRLSTMWE